MKRSVFSLAAAFILTAALVCSADDKAAKPSSSPESTGPVVLTPTEQKELQTILEARLAREREYREALLQVQGAQARFEAANNAAEANFYKLCGRYKVEPEKFEIASDGKSLVPKPSPSSSPKKQ